LQARWLTCGAALHGTSLYSHQTIVNKGFASQLLAPIEDPPETVGAFVPIIATTWHNGCSTK
jgi:hypothetical protein